MTTDEIIYLLIYLLATFTEITSKSCEPGFYHEGATNSCQQCANCTSEAYSGNNTEPACKSAGEPCPRWCGVYNQAHFIQEQYDCGKLPPIVNPITTITSALSHNTSGYTDPVSHGSTTDPSATDTTDTSSPSITVIALLIVVALLCVLLGFFLIHSMKGRNCRAYSKLRVKFGTSVLKTFMVHPTYWHLEIVHESDGSCPNRRFWLTVTNTNTGEKIVEEEEWKRVDERMKITLPSSGSFRADLGTTSQQITDSIYWIQRLKMTVPSRPCVWSLETLMATINSPNSVYNRLCIDLNSSPESVKKIGHVMERNSSVIDNLLTKQEPFAALLGNAMTECDLNVAHIIMGLTRGNMTEKEKRVVCYLITGHGNCVMCQHIKAHNTGAPLPSSIMVGLPDNSSVPI